jgi:carbonic anhydrase
MDEHEQLLANNKVWSKTMTKRDPDFFDRLVNLQQPRFLWIGCSDSRVPSSEITGTLPGQMFVHRNVANMVIHTDMNMLSVIDYGVNVLGIDHLIVCGHYGCGGVKAAMGPEFGGAASYWIREIRDIARLNKEELSRITEPEKRFDRLVELNVAEQAYDLSRTAVLRDAWAKGRKIQVHGWVYSLKDGILKDLGVTRTRYEEEAGAVEV